MMVSGTLLLLGASAVLALSAHSAWRELHAPAWLAIAAPCTATLAIYLVAQLSLAPAASLTIAALLPACALIAEIDRRHYLIPNAMVVAILLLAAIAPTSTSLTIQVAAAVLLGGLFLAVRFVFARAGRSDALGLGDVKLAGAMGALLGPTLGLIAVAFAGFATLVVAAALAFRTPSGALAKGAPFGVGLSAALAVLGVLHLAGLT